MSENTYPEDAVLVPVQINTMGLKGLNTVEAGDVATYDQLAGETGAALKSANANARYRGQLASFRAAFVERVNKDTRIPFKTREVVTKDEDGEETTEHVRNEKDLDYFKRVLDERGEDPEDWQDVGQEVLDGIPFDPSASERGSGGTVRIPKTDLKMAARIFERGEAAAQTAASRLAEIIGKDVAVTVEGIAAALQAKRLLEAKRLEDDLLS